MLHHVAPLAGAWIEIRREREGNQMLHHVAPLAGAWIEIHAEFEICRASASLPSRERGLKSCYVRKVWAAIGRSLRGSMD